MEYKRLNRFKGIDVAEESTDASEQTLRYAENVVLRPRGAVSRMPPFRKLWNLNALGTYAAQLGIIPTVDKTCLLTISQPQFQNNTPAVFLIAHDFKNNKAMGIFCAVDLASSQQDISLETLYDFLPVDADTPTITTTIKVLKKGLAENKRWFFYRFYDAIVAGNGVDENLIYQHARTSMRLRTMGTNLKPQAPTVTSEPTIVTQTVQAESIVSITSGSLVTAKFRLTASTASFLGAAGNHLRFEFLLQNGNGEITSARTGEGTPEVPLLYRIRLSTNGENNTPNLIAQYINRDPLANGVMRAEVFPGQNNDLGYSGFTSTFQTPAFSGGITGTSTASFFPAKSQFAITYLDPGVGSLGTLSTLSDPVTVEFAGMYKIKPVPDESLEAMRFTKILIWWKSSNQTRWLLIAETQNQQGVFVVPTIPTNLDNAVFLENYATSAPPPCTMFELCQEKLFASGNPANPTRVFYSATQNRLSLLPENVSPVAFLEMGARKEEGSNAKVTHLKAMEQRLQVHTSRGITLIHGSTFVRTYSRSDFGAMNPAAATSWSHHISPYLGADGVLYEMSNQQALKSNVASAASWDFIRSFADTAELDRNPWRANVAGDLTNQLVWVWLPCKIDGVTRLAGFLFDYESKSFSGPITWPGLISTTKLSAVDPRIVGQTEDGNLVVIDSKDINRDEFQPAETFTGNLLAITPNTLFFQTQFMDFGTPQDQKAYLEFMFNTVRGSFAEDIKIHIETDEGRTKTFNYGQLRGERNKCVFMLSGYAVRIGMEITLASNRPFVLRDAVLGYARQKTR
jgi:hypothetical protein